MVYLSHVLYSVQPPLLFKLYMFSCLFNLENWKLLQSKKQPGNPFGKLFQFVLLFMGLRVVEFTLRRTFCSGLGTWWFCKKKWIKKNSSSSTRSFEVPSLIYFIAWRGYVPVSFSLVFLSNALYFIHYIYIYILYIYIYIYIYIYNPFYLKGFHIL